MKNNMYITDIKICRDITESVKELFNKRHINLDYKIEYGGYGVIINLNTPSLNYTIMTDIHKIIKDHGYKHKVRPLKNFILFKRDKDHRIKIAASHQETSNQFVCIYLIPEEKEFCFNEE